MILHLFYIIKASVITAHLQRADDTDFEGLGAREAISRITESMRRIK